MTTISHTWEHKAQTITVTKDGYFCTSLDAEVGDEDKVYESLSQAKAAIDHILAEQAKEVRQDIALAVLTAYGTPCTITGVRRGSGNLLVTPRPSRYDRGPEYPDTPQMRALIQRKAQLDAASNVVFGKLRTAVISSMYGARYPQKSDADYPAAVAKLKADYARALAVAQALVVEEATA